LLPANHLAVTVVKSLLQKLPKFNVNSPVPYKKDELLSLHKQNLNIITNYLCYHNLPTTLQLQDLIYNPAIKRNVLENFTNKPLTDNHPFAKLKRLLHVFKLMILPADKTKTLIILPEIILHQELNYHMNDTDTYQQINEEEYLRCTDLQLKMIHDAIRFYNEPKLLPTNPSKRYIYFLPKIHKEVNEWRTCLHPKMRPIISDTNSITNKLAKRMLPILQNIERQILTTVTSSLAVSYNISILNNKNKPTHQTQIATCDVESLFTRIPQDRLLDIINDQVSCYFTKILDKEKFMDYLKTIIKCNIFQINENYCLQKIGLPMGGPLSGTLANIYLGVLEKNVVHIPQICLYNRYMDDILLITNFSDVELNDFLTTLQRTYNLCITSSHNKHSVNFLDMKISVSINTKKLLIEPYCKKHPCYPVPSTLCVRNARTDSSIIKSQILRTWRISNDSKMFTQTINKFLPYLPPYGYHKSIRRSVFRFLQPIKESTHKWTTNIPICHSCQQHIKNKNISLSKIIPIGNKYLSIKEPVNCKSHFIHILIHQENNYLLTFIKSLHIFLENDSSFIGTTIVPIGLLKDIKIKYLLKKFSSIVYEKKNDILQLKSVYPCRIHGVFKNPLQVYGMHTILKKKKSFDSTFNQYKKISRNQK
jgi:hypothetical protein